MKGGIYYKYCGLTHVCCVTACLAVGAAKLVRRQRSEKKVVCGNAVENWSIALHA